MDASAERPQLPLAALVSANADLLIKKLSASRRSKFAPHFCHRGPLHPRFQSSPIQPFPSPSRLPRATAALTIFQPVSPKEALFTTSCPAERANTTMHYRAGYILKYITLFMVFVGPMILHAAPVGELGPGLDLAQENGRQRLQDILQRPLGRAEVILIQETAVNFGGSTGANFKPALAAPPPPTPEEIGRALWRQCEELIFSAVFKTYIHAVKTAPDRNIVPSSDIKRMVSDYVDSLSKLESLPTKKKKEVLESSDWIVFSMCEEILRLLPEEKSTENVRRN